MAEQMKRLFGSLITAQYVGNRADRSFPLRNVMIAEELNMQDDLNGLWTPQSSEEAGRWQSHVRLSNSFYKECITSPVPIDLRAYKALRASPLAMDVYTWLTYRMSYTNRKTRPIRWEALMMQFGSGYGLDSEEIQQQQQAVRNFKRGFLRALKMVHLVYPLARVEVSDAGLSLIPSPTHVSMTIPASSQIPLDFR
ncbi:MAG: hypothetical protein LBI59_08175 [Candidatus Accumulibacter sp.]|nr:hypothetical protein [Accumulibacter sp.]